MVFLLPELFLFSSLLWKLLFLLLTSESNPFLLLRIFFYSDVLTLCGLIAACHFHFLDVGPCLYVCTHVSKACPSYLHRNNFRGGGFDWEHLHEPRH